MTARANLPATVKTMRGQQLIIACMAIICATLIGLLLPADPTGSFALTILATSFILGVCSKQSIVKNRAPVASWDRWMSMVTLIFFSGLVLRRRTAKDASSNPLDLAAANRVLIVMVVAALLLVAALHLRLTILDALVAVPFRWLFFFSLLNFVSTLWSVNQPWTLYRSAEYLVDITVFALAAHFLTCARDLKRLVDLVWLLTGTLVVAVAINIVIAPDLAVQRLPGVIGFGVESVYPVISRNGVGQVSGVIAIVAFSRIFTHPTHRKFYFLVMFAASPFVVISQTRSAIVPLLVAMAIVIALRFRTMALALMIPPAVGVFLFCGGMNGLETYLYRGQQEQQILNLTGRLEYWQLAWDLWEMHPYTGYGAYAGGRFLVGQAFSDSLSSAHGTFPEVLVDTGGLGVFLVALALISVWREVLYNAVRTKRAGDWYSPLGSLSIEMIAVLILLSGRMIFTVTLIWHPSLEFLVIFLFAACARKMRVDGLNHRLPYRIVAS